MYSIHLEKDKKFCVHTYDAASYIIEWENGGRRILTWEENLIENFPYNVLLESSLFLSIYLSSLYFPQIKKRSFDEALKIYVGGTIKGE